MSLLHNPLAEMWGPLFLLLFWIVTIVLAVTVRRAVRSLDSSDNVEPGGPGFKLGTQEVACLRGGRMALLETILFDLRRRGFLKLETAFLRSNRLVRNPEAPAADQLDWFERRLLDECERPVSIVGIPRNRGLLTLAKLRCEELEPSLLLEELLVTSEARARARTIGWATGTLLMVLAGYKLWAATLNGHRNIGFLIISAIVALLIVAACSSLPRQTRRGLAYLERLKVTLGGRPSRPIEEMDALDASAVAVLGFTALHGSPEAAIWKGMTPAAAGGDTGAFVSSCGSSCGGGGGCGSGGCGGCGS